MIPGVLGQGIPAQRIVPRQVLASLVPRHSSTSSGLPGPNPSFAGLISGIPAGVVPFPCFSSGIPAGYAGEVALAKCASYPGGSAFPFPLTAWTRSFLTATPGTTL